MENCEVTIETPPTGLFDFPKLILGGEKKYIDKTALLYRLAKPKTDAQYFISRPRKLLHDFYEKLKFSSGPWIDADAPVFYVGVNYDPEKRGIDDPLVENLPRSTLCC